MDSVSREFELEQALRGLITYMKSLPMVPANYDAIKSAEAVLLKDTEPLVLEGFRPTAVGMVTVAARIYGKSLLLKTTDLSGKERVWPTHKDDIYKNLVDGYLLELRPSQGLHMFRSEIDKQRAFNDALNTRIAAQY